MHKTIIGVMGPGEGATATDMETAYTLGKLIAARGWVLLTGGRNTGVMDAASRGASEAGGLTIGILPGADRDSLSKYVDIPIVTAMGSARNAINVLSSQVVVVCGTGAGTASELFLAIKAKTPVLLVKPKQALVSFLQSFPYADIQTVEDPREAIASVDKILKR